MALNLSRSMGVLFLVISFNVLAKSTENLYYGLSKVSLVEVSVDIINQETREQLALEHFGMNKLPDEKGLLSPSQSVGEVIAVARGIVALGEEVYALVKKGQPIVNTSYSPISVVPQVNNAPVDVLETEGWKAPVKRTYEITYTNLMNIDVVSFRYSVIYSFGGKYNGKGAYLTAVQIIPESLKVLWGFNFDANMKLGGLQNHGSKEDPIAGAVILMDYRMSNALNSHGSVDSFHVTGQGSFKQL